jgi:hypothetical protein
MNSWSIDTSHQSSRWQNRTAVSHERLRYVSGWFCNNAACEYRELAG